MRGFLRLGTAVQFLNKFVYLPGNISVFQWIFEGTANKQANVVWTPQPSTFTTQAFTQQSFYAVTARSVADAFFYGNQKPAGEGVGCAVADPDGTKGTVRTPGKHLPNVPPSPQAHGTGEGVFPDHALRRLRPLARRRLITLRPPGVAMRALNPCLRLRRRLFGWNVRFMA